uniref:hypothetical protein n=1 Tax=Pseudoclavibacter sp. RFBI5 TaxID=2080578 RepID=UPI0011B0B2B3|nr:hypothetical protein [Pseudoclavibacter sp. RFBI5]
MFGCKARKSARYAELRKLAKKKIQIRAQKALEEKNRVEDERKKEKKSRLDRIAAWAGAAGAGIALFGLIITATQNNILVDQLDAQREAARMQGPVLTGVAKVVLDFPGAQLWEPDGSRIERVLKPGEYADSNTQIRVEVVNTGQTTGSVTSAAVQYEDEWLPADALFCGRDRTGLELQKCDFPILVEPGEMKVFTFQIPNTSGCFGETKESDLTASFTAADGERAVLPTGLTATLESRCADYGGNE